MAASQFYLRRRSPASKTTPKKNSDASRIIADFLQWAQHEKGLALCEPYKPQYDWYTPVPYQPKALVAEFLGTSALVTPEHKG